MLERGDASSRAILLVTDGEDHGTSVSSAIAAARRSGVSIYTAGAGTAEGAPVLDPNPITGELTVRVGADGEPVITRLYRENLLLIADEGGGRYVDLAGDDNALASLSGDFNDLAATTFGTEESSQKLERFQILAAIGLLFACIELLVLSLLGRRAARASRLAKLWPAAASTVFIAALCSTTVADINDEANRKYDLGHYEASLDLYRTAQASDPAPELSNNAANALNRLGEYEDALEEALKARGRSGDDAAQEALIEYGIGNHYVGASNLLSAIEAYKRSLLADPADEDAKHNLEVATRRLTPTASPTPPSVELTPTPGGSQPGGPQPDASDATPGDPGEEAQGTPGPQDAPQEPSELTREQIQRLLEEALAGIDREFTPEEAERILDLLEEENRRSVEDSTGGLNGNGQPDY
jgi:tetratricopeptide (TPR) repeat protein